MPENGPRVTRLTCSKCVGAVQDQNATCGTAGRLTKPKSSSCQAAGCTTRRCPARSLDMLLRAKVLNQSWRVAYNAWRAPRALVWLSLLAGVVRTPSWMNLSICSKGTRSPDTRKIVGRATVTVNRMPTVDPRVRELVRQIFAAEQSPWNIGRFTLVTR